MWGTADRRIKPVITLNEQGLSDAMQRLWDLVAARGPRPDGVVGIATGGLIAARVLVATNGLPCFDCALRRPGTAVKRRGLVRQALGRLPYALSDWLRRIEDMVLERRAGRAVAAPQQSLCPRLSAEVAAIADEARARGLRHLLVVDDAVDSGATLGRVVAALRDALPEGCGLSTAVIVETRRKPGFRADVALYREALCRFPWSFDFRGA